MLYNMFFAPVLQIIIAQCIGFGDKPLMLDCTLGNDRILEPTHKGGMLAGGAFDQFLFFLRHFICG